MGVLPFWLPQTRQSEERFFWMIVSVSMGTKPKNPACRKAGYFYLATGRRRLAKPEESADWAKRKDRPSISAEPVLLSQFHEN
ncbi:hypothetical protein [Cryobacterium sp. N22]|uniref:hypothetical protein n=1 Tax=Cryobacterium sp. N22 TaxID=2048290 RepID=UPI0011B05FE5|nr:hypothetical protein [Cryobacterium sp. N22]